MKYYGGIDIGGTKCAAIVGACDESGSIKVLGRQAFKTEGPAYEMLEKLAAALNELKSDLKLESIGISCGSPLDGSRGVILSPPNLPGWDEIKATDYFTERFGVPAYLRNDADACALAEYLFGAGVGSNNMAFLTCGTGFGAGLIFGGKLYRGARDSAGEIGHIRLTDDGPIGYGKAGSFEGYCSGGGIAQLAAEKAREEIAAGRAVNFAEADGTFTAKAVALAAIGGDEAAMQVMRRAGESIGRACALLVDLLNLDRIVIGSIYARNENMLAPIVRAVIERECLPLNAACCEVVAASLGDSVGDLAALATAIQE